MSRAVFFDRDGVLNRAVIREGRPYPPASLAELAIVEGAAEGLASLKAAGFLLVVVTNQPDVARGRQSLEGVHTIHRAMLRQLPLDDFFICAHDDQDGCDCRKPAPGLLVQAQARHGIDLRRSFLVGDRWRDIDAGHAAGCRTVLLDFGYRESGPSASPDARAASLQEAIHWVLREAEKGDVGC